MCSLCLYVVSALISYNRNGNWWFRKDLRLKFKDTLQLDQRLFSLILARGVLLTFCSLFGYTFIVKGISQAQVSFSAIMSLSLVLACITASASYFMFKRDLGSKIIIGISLFMYAIVMFVFS